MELKEKVRRMEEVIKLNHLYMREIWKTLKLMARNTGSNAGGIEKLTNTLALLMGKEGGPINEPEIKEKMKEYVERMFQ